MSVSTERRAARALRPPLAPDAPQHGTPSGYDYHRCRCDRCSAWRRDFNAAYRAANLERLKEEERQRYAANPAPAKARARAQRERDPEGKRAADAAYRAANPGRWVAKAAAWAAANPEKRRAILARYGATSKGRASGRATQQRRRAVKLSVECGCATLVALDAVWSLTGGCCAYCGDTAEHYDHVTALSRGGWHCIANLLPACSRCNQRKSARHLSTFLAVLAAAGVAVLPGAPAATLPCAKQAARTAARMLTAA